MPTRRRLLAAACLALAGGSGCSRIREAITDGGEETTANRDATETTADGAAFRIAVTDGDGEVDLVTGADVAAVGDVEESRTGDGYRLPVTLTEEGAAAFADGLERVGALDDPESHRIRTYFEGDLLYEAKLGPGFVDAVESGEWDGEVLFRVSDRETAEEVKAALEGD